MAWNKENKWTTLMYDLRLIRIAREIVRHRLESGLISVNYFWYGSVSFKRLVDHYQVINY